MVGIRSAHAALHVEHEQCVRLGGGPVTLLPEEERSVEVDGLSARGSRALRPLEQPEADPEGEAIREPQPAEFVVTGDREDLAVLDIGRVGGAAVQRGVHDGSFEMRGWVRRHRAPLAKAAARVRTTCDERRGD
jgi:hypothetical protein